MPVDSHSKEPKLSVIVLGSAGGITEGNLTAYLLAPRGSREYLCIDAGTVLSGLRAAHASGSFDGVELPKDSPLSMEGYVLKECIKAYLISHVHMDHITGLTVSSADDSEKNLLALPHTVEYLREHVFNWKSWPNFCNEGTPPHLNKYHYVRLEAEQEYSLWELPVSVVPFIVSHSAPYESTAFLVKHDDSSLLFVGDTGPDPVEQRDRLKSIWSHVAPLLREDHLRALFLEVSYPNGRPDNMLFGHLTPDWMLYELEQLAHLVDPDHPTEALRGFPVVVTSIKPSYEKESTREQIGRQLNDNNRLGVRFILPEQGQTLYF
jgi:3',5'-cyclic-nucleotide phosphodiesterase